MLLRLLEEGVPVDVILFCDTGLEFPALYDHIRKVEQDIGREITTVKCPDDFEYLFAHKQIKRKPKSEKAVKCGTDHDGYSWAGPAQRWCTELLKNQPREQYLRNLREKYEVLEYIGIASDEITRINICNVHYAPLSQDNDGNSNMFYTRFPVPDTTHAPTSRCSGTLLLFLSILPAVPYALALVHSSLAHLS